MSKTKILGILKPIGGGDPIPLTKERLLIGRRPSCDICLDFERISGKHCELRFVNGLWHIRDVGSTNGTTVHGLKHATEQSVLPDVEIGIAGHYYTIDYEPAGPSSVVESSQLLDEDVIETRTRKSLMELAGLEVDGPRKSYRPAKAPEKIERISAAEGDFEQDLPSHLPPIPTANTNLPSDDDFFDMIREDLGGK